MPLLPALGEALAIDGSFMSSSYGLGVKVFWRFWVTGSLIQLNNYWMNESVTQVFVEQPGLHRVCKIHRAKQLQLLSSHTMDIQKWPRCCNFLTVSQSYHSKVTLLVHCLRSQRPSYIPLVRSAPFTLLINWSPLLNSFEDGQSAFGCWPPWLITSFLAVLYIFIHNSDQSDFELLNSFIQFAF